ncbi:hypothetical protein DC498_05375 [Terrimonas sp.]|nr:hypothetical protein DC498_05375 [Terrimonas sp.]
MWWISGEDKKKDLVLNRHKKNYCHFPRKQQYFHYKLQVIFLVYYCLAKVLLFETLILESDAVVVFSTDSTFLPPLIA